MTDFRRCGVSARDDRTAIREADDRVSCDHRKCRPYSNAAERRRLAARLPSVIGAQVNGHGKRDQQGAVGARSESEC